MSLLLLGWYFYEELNDVYVVNIQNLRLSGIANLESYIALPNNYFCNAIKKILCNSGW